MIDASALKLLIDTAKQTAGQQVKIEPGGLNRILWVGPDGTTKTLLEPVRRRHQAASLGTIADLAVRWGTTTAVWVALNKVVVFENHSDRLDYAEFSIDLSEPMAWLMKLPQSLSQRDLIFALRVTMHGCCPDGVLESVRSITWEREEAKASTVARGKSSIGKMLREEIKGMDALPEYVTFQVPILKPPYHVLAKVTVAVDPDESNQTFRLTPMPGAIEQAVWDGEEFMLRQVSAAIEEAVGSEDHNIPIYHGSP